MHQASAPLLLIDCDRGGAENHVCFKGVLIIRYSTQRRSAKTRKHRQARTYHAIELSRPLWAWVAPTGSCSVPGEFQRMIPSLSRTKRPPTAGCHCVQI